MTKKTRKLMGKILVEGMKAYEEDVQTFFGLCANHVKSQKAIVGGNFAVAFAVPYKAIREHIRRIIPEVVFVVLTLNKEQCCQNVFS